MLEPALTEINTLFQRYHIHDQIVGIQRLSGTTDGVVFKLKSAQDRIYILKYDSPYQIALVEQLLRTYEHSFLLPKIISTADDKTNLIYTYIDGTTHFNRGKKQDWLTLLAKELLNKYVKYEDASSWGRIEYPRNTWKEFNEISIEEAKVNIGSILTDEDYHFVRLQVNKLFNNITEQEDRYFLHGDTGVHNFVYKQSSLVGVIDPSPMIGPIIYDFLYAFCSSPDDLNVETLFAAYDHLEQGKIERNRLIDEVSVQLYCRIGLSIKHHPNDLPEYLAAWDYWKAAIE